LNALIETSRVSILSGTIARYPMPTDSGRPHGVDRCPTCGTAVWSEYGGIAALRFVRVGTLDEPDRVPPDIHIFTMSKQPWVVLPDGTPAVKEYYQASKMWPKESLERRAALRRR